MRLEVKWLGWVVVLATFAVAAPARAQVSATLSGTVTDAATKQPLADVIVTATIGQDEQLVVTDAQGNYTFPRLPQGVYTLRAEKEGYKPYSVSGLPMRKNAQFNIQMIPAPIKGELEKAPAKDAPPEKPSGAKTP